MASTRLGSLAIRRELAKAVPNFPNIFLRFKEGDVNNGLEIIKNNPIQNNRRSSIHAVPGKVDTSGSYKLDVDPNDVVHFLSVALGYMDSTDISSLTDGSVWEHVMDTNCKIQTLTMEQAKGELCDDPLTQNGQVYSVDRAFGVMIDSIKISGSDNLLNCEMEVQAHGLFQKAKVVTNESPEAAGTAITNAVWSAGTITFTSTAHGLVVNDIVAVTGMTPSGYDGVYKVTAVPGANDFEVELAVDPGAFSAGGTATKQAMFYFDTVEGVVAGDNGKFFERTGGTYENVVVTYVDTNNNVLAFASVTSTAFTVTNDSKFELLPQTPSYDTPLELSFTHCRFRFGTDVADAYLNEPENIEDREFEYMNNLEARYGSLRRSPSVIAEKGAGAMLNFTKYFETTNDRDRYLDQVKRSGVLTITNNQIISPTDTNQHQYTINVEFSDIRYTEYTMETGTDELYAIKASAEAFFDVDDGRAIRIKVKNKHTGTFYTS